MQSHESPQGFTPRNRIAAQQRTPRTVAELLKELRDETTVLFRQEVELAKVEMSEKASRLSRHGLYVAVGGLVAYAGIIILLIALVAGAYGLLVAAGLSHMTAGWLAPLLTGVAVAAAGYGFVRKGLNTIKNESVLPERTVDTLRSDKEWIQEKISK